MKPIEQLSMFSGMLAAKDAGRCPFCRKAVSVAELKDETSRQEFQISGLCQACQDQTFSEED